MEKELNIAAILKDKPNARIYDLLHNIYVELDNISTTDGETVIWCTKEYPDKTSYFGYSELGTERGWLDGLQILKPSKKMRDWSKFAWKKGDVLTNDCGFQCIFKEWASDDYTKFNGCYSNSRDGYEYVSNADTMKFEKVDSYIAYGYIREIEKKLGGKLNLSTLEIEKPKPEFKDGDIVFVKGETKDSNSIGIVMNVGNGLNYHYWANYFYRTDVLRVAESYDDYVVGHSCDEEVRMANSSEKQKLLNALAKEGKVWNPDTKQIEDLPKKCEFKPMDWCLMRDRCIGESWKLCQFGFFDEREDFDRAPYNAVGGNWYNECIPYNDSTKHLLGTTDEWKGCEG